MHERKTSPDTHFHDELRVNFANKSFVKALSRTPPTETRVFEWLKLPVHVVLEVERFQAMLTLASKVPQRTLRGNC